MFKNRILLILLLMTLTLFFSSLMVSAQDVGVDDQGNPNDPTINDRANACYTDPRFIDQCDVPVEWVCGYVVIRYDFGLYDRDMVADAGCGAYLPPEADLISMVSSNASVPSASPCTLFNLGASNPYVDTLNNIFRPAPAQFTFYADNACSMQDLFLRYIRSSGSLLFTLDGIATAQTMCDTNAPGTTAFPSSVPAFYQCIP